MIWTEAPSATYTAHGATGIRYTIVGNRGGSCLTAEQPDGTAIKVRAGRNGLTLWACCNNILDAVLTLQMHAAMIDKRQVEGVTKS